MPEIRPFAGIRYNPSRVMDLSRVVAPPYDVIDPSLHRQLLDQDQANCVRLDLGEAPGQPGDYGTGAALLARWLRNGIFIREAGPAFYLIEDTFLLEGEDLPHRRWGIVGAVRLEPFGEGRIRPHERTHSGPKADRMRLMKAFRGNLSQVFGLFDGDPRGLKALLAPVFSSPPVADFPDADGVRRRMWVIREGALQAEISRLLSDRDIYIADGHHRYETALGYSREMQAADPDPSLDRPYRFVMMALVGLEDPGLAILPTHRLLHGFPRFDFSKILSGLDRAFMVEELSPGESHGVEKGLLPHHGRGERGFILFVPGEGRFFRAVLRPGFDLDAEFPDLSPPVRGLEVNLVERLLLMRELDLTADQISHKEHLEYYNKDVRPALEAARTHGQLLVLMNPARMEELIAVTRAGERMPQKSTFFYPKLLTGMVFFLHGP